MTTTILQVENLVVEFKVNQDRVRAVDDVSLELRAGELVGLVGESGSGKSTLAYAMMNLLPRQGRLVSGKIALATVGDISRWSEPDMSRVRGNRISMVFQATQSTFNPIRTLESQFKLLFRAHGINVQEGLIKARRLLQRTQLDPQRILTSYPHQLSGGMRQRVGIVFAMVLEPDVILLDEPTTALDVLSQRVVLDLIRDLRSQTDAAMLFITHDFSVVSNLSQRIGVMYAGKLVELAPTERLYRFPQHPYTALLTRAVPSISQKHTELVGIPGQPPHLSDLPPGCRFSPRCPYVQERCRERTPPWSKISADQGVACFRWSELGEELANV
ncbi:MAG: hypothetical protein C7B46_03750 [Sulfobacillus benefaciens]|uniref:ABC transporter domain-containing protein n=1 Tax=Sulfobacillus benefaciens TaxID=453960 RepID=A0A2T2XK09_9FIRM|nr:MAG: hypothetical protein C7B46_03750 [Sulfobacillus benefaciens]